MFPATYYSIEHEIWCRAGIMNYKVKDFYNHTEWYHLPYKLKEIIEKHHNVRYVGSRGYFVS